MLLTISPSKAFAVVAVMIARVRPSLNGAREALKTWDEASVVWPRFEVCFGIFIPLWINISETCHYGLCRRF